MKGDDSVFFNKSENCSAAILGGPTSFEPIHKQHFIKKTALRTSIKEYFRKFAVYNFLDEGWNGRMDERMKGEGNVPSRT